MNSAAITELTVESASLRLWDEFLGGYFDGAGHAVGLNAPVVFPRASLKFQQASQPQPLPGLGLSVVWVRPSRTELTWDTVAVNGQPKREQVAYAATSFMFWVRAALPDPGTGTNAKALAMQGGELLYGLLNNSMATKPLAQKGIHHLRPETPQLVSADTNYELRMLNCRAVLRYAVLSQA